MPDEEDVRIEDFTNILENLTVEARYLGDLNNNGVADDTEERFTVTFVDSFDGRVLKTERVLPGLDATAPAEPNHNGMTFVGWSVAYTNVTRNLTVEATYEDANAEVAPVMYTVRFVDSIDGSTIATMQVQQGLSATAPVAPTHEEKVFTRWQGTYTNVQADAVVTALYGDDVNGNGVNDDTEQRYSVKFVVDGNGTLNGTLEYNGVLGGLSFKDANITVPTPEAMENYEFAGWEPDTPNDDTVVEDTTTYSAVFTPIHDKNKNGIADEEEIHTLTIEYQYSNGKEASKSYEHEYYYTEEFSIEVPTIENMELYTISSEPDLLKGLRVEGTMGEEDINVIVVYTPKNDANKNEIPDELEEFTLTINYVYGDGVKDRNGKDLSGQTAKTSHIEKIKYNASYSVTSPKVANYVTEKTVVEGVMPLHDVTITVVYTVEKDVNGNGIPDPTEAQYQVKFTIDPVYQTGTVHGYLQDTDGSLHASLNRGWVVKGATLDAAGVIIPELVIDENYELAGWSPVEPTGDYVVEKYIEFNATVRPKHDKNNNGKADEEEVYTLNIEYVYEDGKTASNSYTESYHYTEKFSVDVPTIKNMDYYDVTSEPNLLKGSKIEGTMGEEDINVVVKYTPKHDDNNNNIPDELDDKYTISFEIEGKGTLNGTTKYENVLEGISYKDANIIVPDVNVNEYYKLDGWYLGSVDTKNKIDVSTVSEKIVSEDLTYIAKIVPINDINNNGTADEEEETYTVTFNTDGHGTLSLNGEENTTFVYENVVKGATLKDNNIVVPDVVYNADLYDFLGWSDGFKTYNFDANTQHLIEGNTTFTAKFNPKHDDNGNGIADEEELYTITVTYKYTNESGEYVDMPLDENPVTYEFYYGQSYDINPEKTLLEYYVPSNEDGIHGTIDESTPKNQQFVIDYVLKEDLNKNNIPDKKEGHYNILFNITCGIEGTNGTECNDKDFGVLTDPAGVELGHTKQFNGVLEGLTYGDTNSHMFVPIPKAKGLYKFVKWVPSTPTDETVVQKPSDGSIKITYTAYFAPINDANHNGIADEEEIYTLNIEYVYKDGTTASDTYTNHYHYNEEFSVDVPEIEDMNLYEVSSESDLLNKENLTIEGTKGEKNINVKVVYTPRNDENKNNIPDEKETKYSVTYDANGATKGEVPTDNNKYLKGTSVVIQGNSGDLIKDDVVFDGWSTTKYEEAINEKIEGLLNHNDTIVIEDHDITLYAVYAEDKNGNKKPDYEEEKYTVTFMKDGTEIKTVKVLTGTMIDSSDMPTAEEVAKAPEGRYEYVFLGWFDESNNEVTFEQKINADMIVYAHYESKVRQDHKVIVKYIDTNGDWQQTTLTAYANDNYKLIITNKIKNTYLVNYKKGHFTYKFDDKFMTEDGKIVDANNYIAEAETSTLTAQYSIDTVEVTIYTPETAINNHRIMDGNILIDVERGMYRQSSKNVGIVRINDRPELKKYLDCDNICEVNLSDFGPNYSSDEYAGATFSTKDGFVVYEKPTMNSGYGKVVVYKYSDTQLKILIHDANADTQLRSVTYNGKSLDFTHEADGYIVTLDTNINNLKGQEIDVTVESLRGTDSNSTKWTY